MGPLFCHVAGTKVQISFSVCCFPVYIDGNKAAIFLRLYFLHPCFSAFWLAEIL